MDNKDKNEFLVIISGLAEEFGGKASKDNVKLRFEALREYPIDNISKAATWILKNREKTFPAIPTTKEMIDAIGKIGGKLESETAAQLECDKVLRNLKNLGVNCPTDFKDPITRYLMQNRWSFRQLGTEKEQDLKWFRKAFVEAYQSMDSQKIDAIEYSGNKGMIPAENLKKLLK